VVGQELGQRLVQAKQAIVHGDADQRRRDALRDGEDVVVVLGATAGVRLEQRPVARRHEHSPNVRQRRILQELDEIGTKPFDRGGPLRR
jgi:hypothetical protein